MPSAWRNASPAIRWIGVVVAGLLALILLLLLALTLVDWNAERTAVARAVGARLHRAVSIGHLSVQLWRWQPAVRAEEVRVGNPDWAGGGDMASAASIDFAIELRRLLRGQLVLARLEVDQPRVDLRRQGDGRANWDFSAGGTAPATGATKLPTVRLFTVRGGQLAVRDEIRKLHFQGSVAAREDSAHPEAEPFNLRGRGELNAKPFELSFSGGALFNLTPDKPYPFDTEITAGPTHVQSHGSIDRPFDLSKLSLSVQLSGENLADLYYLSGVPLPFTHPYHLTAHLRREGMNFQLTDLDGTVGHSDLRGTASIDAGGKRPRLTADLLSHALDLADLAPSVGAGVHNGPEADSSAPVLTASGPLLPTYRFSFDRLRAMDAQVQLRADAVRTQKVPMKGVLIHLRLDDAVLRLEPLEFELPEGKLGGTVRVDASADPAATTLDLRLTGVRLEQFRGKDKHADPPLVGLLQSRARLQGHGNSVHDIAADANGQITVVLPHGEINRAFAELTGINVAEGLGLLLSKKEAKTDVRCGVASFKVQDGDAQAERIIIDTDPVLITGHGDINLKTEALNLDVSGQPKKLRLLRVRAPISIRGTLSKPHVGVNPAKTLGQGGAAAALGALLSPVAAALAFIDPGLAKNADCAALLSQTQSESVKPPSAPAPSGH